MGSGDRKREERNHQLLEAVIVSYAESGVPVGSEFLVQKYRLEVSPATVRNAMAELEDQGLITHPHTSAGRIPTDRGYRYYVDLLMQHQRLRPYDEEQIQEIRQVESESPTSLLEEASRLLGDLSREAGLALVPQLAHGSFGRLEFIRVGDRGGVVGVLITDEGMVKHARFELPAPAEPDFLERWEAFLNQDLSGMPLAQIPGYLMGRMGRQEQESLPDEDLWGSSLLPLFHEEASVILEGASRVLQAPEFRDLQRTRRLLQGLEEKSDLVGILQRDLWANGVKLHIGSENQGTAWVDCAIVSAPYRLAGGVMGTIGVLGPTRMDYPRVTSLVHRVAEAVTQAFLGR